MNNISNYELAILNKTMERIADSLEDIASALSSIDDGIAIVNDTIETNLERLVPDE